MSVNLLITGDGTATTYPFPSGSSPLPPWYNKINEASPDYDTTFLETDDVYPQPTYNNNFLKQSLSLPIGATITSVSVVGVIRRVPDATYPCTPQGHLGFLIGGTIYNHATVISPPTTWDTYERNFPTNPATSLPWTVSDVDSAEIHIDGISCARLVQGVRYFSLYRVTQVYLIVYYTLPGRPPSLLKIQVITIHTS